MYFLIFFDVEEKSVLKAARQLISVTEMREQKQVAMFHRSLLLALDTVTA